MGNQCSGCSGKKDEMQSEVYIGEASQQFRGEHPEQKTKKVNTVNQSDDIQNDQCIATYIQ